MSSRAPLDPARELEEARAAQADAEHELEATQTAFDEERERVGDALQKLIAAAETAARWMEKHGASPRPCTDLGDLFEAIADARRSLPS